VLSSVLITESSEQMSSVRSDVRCRIAALGPVGVRGCEELNKEEKGRGKKRKEEKGGGIKNMSSVDNVDVD
jgi:hypothetical protein